MKLKGNETCQEVLLIATLLKCKGPKPFQNEICFVQIKLRRGSEVKRGLICWRFKKVRFSFWVKTIYCFKIFSTRPMDGIALTWLQQNWMNWVGLAIPGSSRLENGFCINMEVCFLCRNIEIHNFTNTVYGNVSPGDKRSQSLESMCDNFPLYLCPTWICCLYMRPTGGIQVQTSVILTNTVLCVCVCVQHGSVQANLCESQVDWNLSVPWGVPAFVLP